jgi:hypothetical protein
MSSALITGVLHILGRDQPESALGGKWRINNNNKFSSDKLRRSRPRHFSRDGLKYRIEISGFLLAVRGDMRDVGDASVVLQSVGPLTCCYASPDGAIAVDGGIILGLSQETWRSSYERKGQDDIPGTAPFSNVIKFITTDKKSPAGSSSTVEMCAVLMKLSGSHFERMFQCCMDALRGNIDGSKGSMSMWRAAEEVQLRVDSCSYVSTVTGGASSNEVSKLLPVITKEVRIGAIAVTATRVPTSSGGRARLALSCTGTKVLKEKGMTIDMRILSFAIEDESTSRSPTQPIAILMGLHYADEAHRPCQLKVSSANVMITSAVVMDMMPWVSSWSSSKDGPPVQSLIAQEGTGGDEDEVLESMEISLDMMSMTILVPSSSLYMHKEDMMGLSASFSGVDANVGGRTASYHVRSAEVVPCRLSLRDGQFERSASRALR